MNVNLPTIKILMIPVIVIFVTIILFIVTLSTFGPRIPTILETVRSTNTDVENLKAKIEVLNTFRQEVTDDKSDITYIVLPDTNPGAIAIAQVKGLIATNENMQIEKIDMTSSPSVVATNNSSNIDIELSTDQISNIERLLVQFQNLAPLVTVDNLEINSRSGEVSAELKLSVYWSELPETLPQLDQPVNELNANEVDLLNRIILFNLPTFSLSTPSDPNTQRVNPFN